MTTPMTAAEWPKYTVHHLDPVDAWARVKAALEEREAMLARVVSGVGGRRRSGMSAVLEAEADSVKEGRKFNVAERVLVIRRAAQRIRELEDVLSGWEENAVKHSTDAAVGALVRRIREHRPEVYFSWNPHPMNYNLDESGLSAALDSLLPKEPEVAPSGWTYEPAPEYGSRCWRRTGTAGRFSSERDIQVPPIDREFVAKLLEGRENG